MFAVSILGLSLTLVLACKKKKDPDPAPSPTPTACTPVVVNVTTDITTPTVWSPCSLYVISNAISVSSSLTIEAGTIIKIKASAGDNAVIVSNSGRIIASGSDAKPVVFTSFKDDANGGDSNGDGTATAPARYDWGGIIINNNTCEFRYCKFLYGGLGPGSGAGQPSLEFSYYYGLIDHCTFAYCGGESSYAGYGVVDARGSENPNFAITNSVFYGNIKPLFLSPHNSLDNSNTFHNPANVAETNQLNGVFLTSTSNEPTTNVSWLETEVPFVLTGSFALKNGLKLTLASNVIIKISLLPSRGYNWIQIREGSSLIDGYNLPGVYFTSYLDDAHGGDTNGDGAASSPAAGDWYGVLDNSATIPTNNHCYSWPGILYAQYP